MEVIEPIPAEGTAVPIRSASSGLKYIPLLSFGFNTLSAQLRLFENGFETKVIFTTRSLFSEIESIDVISSLGRPKLKIIWKDSPLTFVAGMNRDDLLGAVIRFFYRKSVPLTENAKIYLNAGKD